MPTKLKALLATGRVSNLPTVWCNCLAAVLILFHQSENGIHSYIQQPWNQSLTYLTIYLVFFSTCIYVGGCFMGDFHDRKFDALHKPDRPIPAGILSKNTVAGIGFSLLFFSILGAPIIPSLVLEHVRMNIMFLPVMFLVYSVNNYSQWHKKSLFIGLPLIGLCRFFLIIFAAAAASILLGKIEGSPGHERFHAVSYFILPIIIYAAAVCIYTIAFASVARTESSDSPITWRNLLRYTMLALPLTVLFTNQSLQIETITALVIYALWLSYAFSFLSKNKGNYVSKCLAGFCLLDACFLAQFGWIWVVICLILFLLALALQKIAPAT
ncbi:MAG: hypothetical protein ACI9SQ_000718 [Rubritalea sp.]|jgi:hypothetical protein